jgi:four helix bundle protein
MNQREEAALAVAMDFEKLEVYGLATEFVSVSYALVRELSSEFADIVSQLRRASSSVALNIAEGADRIGPKDKANRYAIAKGSAEESAAALELLARMGAISASDHLRARALAARICRGLTALSKATLKRA